MGYSTCRNPAFLARKFGKQTCQNNTIGDMGDRQNVAEVFFVKLSMPEGRCPIFKHACTHVLNGRVFPNGRVRKAEGSRRKA